MSKKIIVVYFTLLLIVYGKSQNWATIGSGFSNYPNVFFVDTVNTRLYALGPFTNAGGHIVKGATVYNGVEWDTMPLYNDLAVFNSLACYDSMLIFGENPLMTWDGLQIDTIATFPMGGARGAIVYDGELVVFGWFDTIEGIAANSIATWNGTSWSRFDTTKWYQPIVSAIEYKGELYIGGNMSNYNGTMDRLARWNGTKWLPVGNGIRGGLASVGSFEIYDDDLYIGGGFQVAQGNPGNCVARWDGTQWKDAGIGMTSSNAVIHDLQIYDNHLYACGQFLQMGNLPVKGIAKWDGSKWCGLGQDAQPNHTITCMAVYNNELYIGGPFKTIDGDTMNYVAKWIGANYTDTCGIATGLNEIEESTFALYPNPTTHQLTIQASNLTTGSYQITTTTGQLILQKTITRPNFTIDVSTLPPGLYFLQLTNGCQRVVKRFVKQ